MATGIPWLVTLAHGRTAAPTPQERSEAALSQQIERLEAYLQNLGTVHNRAFSAREKEIREGLSKGDTFEAAQVLLGEHLGYAAGKRESDASPDPWWQSAGVVIVFEDHANAKGDTAIIDAKKARQAASHPDWVREFVPGTANALICPVLVTPAKRAKAGALPHLNRVFYWDLADFRSWAEKTLVTIRDLRRSFVEPGDLVWRAEAADALVSIKADAPGLADWLQKRPARDHLKAVS
jgi:hypothetical protein